MSINVNDKNIGHATAYAYYKAGGGTMTEAEFTEFMADFGTASQTAVEAAQAALASKNAAQTAATTATTKASEATTAAQTATTKAGEASTSASTATSAKDTAVSASQTATSKATEATTAATTATSAATTATTAKDDAVSAKTAAQTAQTGAETAAASVSASAAQIATNTSDISELKEDLNQQTIFADTVFEHGSVVYDLTYTNNAMNSTTGQQSDASSKRASTPDLYYIPIETELHISWDATVHTFLVFCFDEDLNYLGYVDKSSVSNGGVLTLKNGTRWMRFFMINVDNSDLTPEQAESYATYTVVYIGRINGIENSIEIINTKVDSMLVNNNLLAGLTPKEGYFNGSQNISSDYIYFEKVPVEANKTYTIYPRSRMVYIYDASGTLLNYVNQQNITSVTASGNGFAYVTYYAADNLDGASFYEVNAVDVFGRETYALSDNIIIPSSLTGKKWAVLGDSFTAGADSGTIQDGTYAGQKIVYPYLIGNRTGINVLSFFGGGRTLAYPAVPGDFINSVTCQGQPYYYQNIPSNVDYVTIYLGINDHHHLTGGGDGEDPTGVIDLGTISDDTVATYYGAWNVVISWLIANRPNAHIGIIVSNGITSTPSQESAHPTAEQSLWRKAQIDIAEKYGIPYIDLNGDARTRAMIRTSNPNIPDAIKQKMIENWAVDYAGGNYHPNNAAHKFESFIIEAFLRTI